MKTPRLACQVSRLDWRRHHRQMNHRDGKQARAKPLERIGGHTHSSGLDLETKIFSPSGRGRTFFLTCLFIELTDPPPGVLSAIAWLHQGCPKGLRTSSGGS